ncbi:hypothetical protein [Collimonas sp.]|jgi:hypothetical protein|uniref:hypothetical protein n=1 Tax=Collimonas sp. TaxID=1963772 RepID=UPI002BD6F3C9|nr:hypothetical protein [Collimonas sp.]HWW07752.1 hypothetical protein [Collimonas sp.]
MNWLFLFEKTILKKIAGHSRRVASAADQANKRGDGGKFGASKNFSKQNVTKR